MLKTSVLYFSVDGYHRLSFLLVALKDRGQSSERILAGRVRGLPKVG